MCHRSVSIVVFGAECSADSVDRDVSVRVRESADCGPLGRSVGEFCGVMSV